MLRLEPRTIAAIEDKGQSLVVALREAYKDKNINASGLLSASVRFAIEDSSLVWYATDYYPYPDEGREPGGLPPVSAIKQWIIDKGIQVEGSLDGMAWAIAKSIAQKGNIAYQVGGKFIVADTFTQEQIDGFALIIQTDANLRAIQVISKYFNVRT